jgi:phosphatidylglycerophosphate synthase
MAQLSLKARDGWWTALVIDPIAGPLVAAARGWPWVTPNRITLVSGLIGLGAGAAFALDQLVLGALAFQLSFLLDCMDGKLAKNRGESTPWGHFFDVAADSGRVVFAVAGLAYATAGAETLDPGWIAVIAAYPGIRFATVMVGDARAERRADGWIDLPATPLAILRAAPSRLAHPGSTVDTEMVAFTLAPIFGLTLEGFAVAAAVDLAHLTLLVVSGIRRETR